MDAPYSLREDCAFAVNDKRLKQKCSLIVQDTDKSKIFDEAGA